MLVVIEIDDWDSNDGLAAELRMLQKSQEDITGDPLFDPDEPDEAMVLKTDVIQVNVARIVGVLQGNAEAQLTVIPLSEA